jgi:hypothetical protein
MKTSGEWMYSNRIAKYIMYSNMMADFVNTKQATKGRIVDGTALCSFPEQNSFLVHHCHGRLCLLYSRACAISKWRTGAAVLLLTVTYRTRAFYSLSVEKKTRCFGENSLEGSEHCASRCCIRHPTVKCCMLHVADSL